MRAEKRTLGPPSIGKQTKPAGTQALREKGSIEEAEVEMLLQSRSRGKEDV